jgi:ABC-2 type transport system ATP-binding protein
MEAVSVANLQMTFRAPVREEGLRAAVGSLFRREYREVRAVRDLSFSMQPGEVVGFLGPNGAGKTTTMKILSGILHPTEGRALVLSHVPWRRERAFLRQIAMVRGSRPIAGPGELTVLDTLRFQQLIYEVPGKEFARNLDELTSMLNLAPVLDRQIRALSLGERMRAGLAMSLIYRPRVLFLDEPTLGLDVTAVGMIRSFIIRYAAQTGATILLTSHYMADVESLCRRIVLINNGELWYDGDIEGLANTLLPYKLVRIEAQDGARVDWDRYGDVIESANGKASLRIHREQVPQVTARLLSELQIADLSVTEPPLESVMDQVYREGLTT